MKNLFYYIAVSSIGLMALSCKSNHVSKQSSNDITGKTWKLIEVRGQAVASQSNTPYFSLDKAEKRYTGHGGCNGISGTFEISPDVNRIKFNQGISTMIACNDLETEKLFTDAILHADNYSLKGDTLSLNKARMATLAKFILQK
ncbi:META domain-containing protein [Chryseobacterium sp. CT-SW4]|uniref:META domain-containing protein n=1 Tax=Chryseobacterium sp. SW-1 TaxID=3157343 RepID=UPI003B02C29D